MNILKSKLSFNNLFLCKIKKKILYKYIFIKNLMSSEKLFNSKLDY